jgi:ABC-type lipoprotein release transport system permease subunit
MMLIKIAWRSIWRSKIRSSVVILAIAFGLLGGLFSSAWMNGMADQRVQDTFDFETGHVQIHEPDYIENEDVKKTIRGVDEKLESLKADPRIASATSRLRVSGMAATANKNMGVNVIGVDPESERSVFALYQKIDTAGGSFVSEDKKNPIVISRALATELNARIKSKIVLTFQDYNGEITGAAFKVTGIYKTDNTPWDKLHVFVLNRDLRRVLEVPADEAHEIALKMIDFDLAPDLATDLGAKYPNLLVQDWAALSPYLRLMSGYMDTMMALFMAIILGALGFGIVNTMLMVVLERTRELGMLMAIGMTRKRIFLMILYETIFLALIGALVGELMSVLCIHYFGQTGIDLSNYAEGMEAVGYSAMTYPMLEPYRYFQITVLVLITAILASIYPALKALRLQPAEAVRTL